MDKAHVSGEGPTRLPVVQRDREPITEAEARRIGAAAHQLARLKDGLAKSHTGALVIGTGVGSSSISLSRNEMEAVLSLLIEREAVFLSSFGVEVEPIQ